MTVLGSTGPSGSGRSTLGMSHLASLSQYSTSQSTNMALSFLKAAPCLGFVRTSHHILSVALYCIDISPASTLSLTKKYRDLMCFVCLLLDHLPFVAKIIVDLLSWTRMFCLTV